MEGLKYLKYLEYLNLDLLKNSIGGEPKEF